MPETLSKIKKRAKRLGFKRSSIVKGKTGFYLSPKGIKKKSAKKAYASCRSRRGAKAKCAKIAWSVENK